MTHPSGSLQSRLLALPSLMLLWSTAFGQDFSLGVADSDPLGIGSFIPVIEDFDIGINGKFKGTLYYGAELEGTYNSNFFLTETNEKSEFSALITPWFRYVSDPEGGAQAVLSANYRPTVRTFLHNSDNNGVDQSGDVALRMRGGRTDITLFARRAESTGTDRLTGNFTNASITTFGFRGSRQVAPRTNMNAGWTFAVSDFDNATDVGSEINTIYVGGMWRATERIGLGGTLRYTGSDSDNIGSSDAWALLLEARYRVGERVFLSASLGPEFAQTSDNLGNDTDNVRVSGRLAGLYMINERWTWSNTIRTATVPSPSQNNYLVYDVAFSTALTHQLQKGSLTGGLEFNFSEYEDVGTVTNVRGNEQTYSAFLGYRRDFLSNRLKFESRVRYALNDGFVDWKQLFVTTGVTMRF